MSEKVYVSGLESLLGSRNVMIGVTTKSESDGFDVILVGRDMLALETRKKTLQILDRGAGGTKFAVLDCLDDLSVDRIANDRRICVYFKREVMAPNIGWSAWSKYLLDRLSNSNLRSLTYLEVLKLRSTGRVSPILLSYVPDAGFVPSKSKTHIVSFIANLHPAYGNIVGRFSKGREWANRQGVANTCIKQEGHCVILQRANVQGGIPHSTYMRIISDSVCSVAPSSASFDTVRYWEILYAGSVVIAERTPLVRPQDLMGGESVLYYKGWSDLSKKIKYIAKNSEAAILAGRKGREYVMKYHSPLARGEQIIQQVKG